MKHPRTIVFDVDTPFHELWLESSVQDAYLEWVDNRINQLIDNLYTYNPDEITLAEYKASIEMLAYTTTELLAQFCAGGFRWLSSDKARFLSPTVDLETVIRDRVIDDRGHLGLYFDSVKLGVWGFLEMSEYTKNWLEAKKLGKQQVSYLIWSAKKALDLLNARERIEGFTNLALSDSEILDGYCKCESPIESIFYMQLVMDGLRPPVLQNQYNIGQYRADFAIPSGQIVIECDGKKYHDAVNDAERDRKLKQMGWIVIRFLSEKILMDPSYCSSKIHDEYPWKMINSKQNTGSQSA